MKNVSFIISILFLIILMSSKPALCQGNGGTAISDSLQNVKNELKKTNKNSKDYKKIDVFLGSGLMPFRIYAGMGYFILPKIEGYVKLASMLVPQDDYHIILWVKFLVHEKSTLFYTYEAGVFFGPDFDGQNFIRKLNGINLEGGFGYLLRFNSGFHIGSDLKLGLLFQKHEKPYLFPVLDLSIGWTF